MCNDYRRAHQLVFSERPAAAMAAASLQWRVRMALRPSLDQPNHHHWTLSMADGSIER